jgi:hypothetical protein
VLGSGRSGLRHGDGPSLPPDSRGEAGSIDVALTCVYRCCRTGPAC